MNLRTDLVRLIILGITRIIFLHPFDCVENCEFRKVGDAHWETLNGI